MLQFWFLFILTVLCWGTPPIFEKYGLTTRNTDPLTGLLVRSIAVFSILFITCAIRGKIAAVAKMPPKVILVFVLSGVMAGLLGMWAYYKLLKISPSSKIVPLVAIYPLVTAVLSFAILNEQFSWQRLVGTVLIVLGVLLVK